MDLSRQAKVHAREVDRIVQEMESRVLDTTWAAQSRIPSERALASLWNVSRSTVREAIQRLAARGLLVSRHGSGVFVTDRLHARFASPWAQLLNEHPLRRTETFEFRRVFECAMARFAAERATPEELEQMGAIIGRMEDAIVRGDVEAEAVADVDFHSALASASHNAMFRHFNASVIVMLREHIKMNTFDAMLDEHAARRRTQARMRQHRRIYEAVRRQQPGAASRAMQVHIDFVEKQFAQLGLEPDEEPDEVR